METIIIDDKTVSVNGVRYLREEPKFKVGEWIIGKNGYTPYNPSRITSLSSNLIYYLCWNGSSETSSFMDGQSVRHATKDEIEKHLIQIAKDKGFLDMGVKFKSINQYEIGVVREIKPYDDNDDDIKWEYIPDLDSLYCASGLTTRACNGTMVCSNPSIYIEGRWAEVIPSKKKLPTTKQGIGELINRYHNQNEGLPFKTPIDEFLNNYED